MSNKISIHKKLITLVIAAAAALASQPAAPSARAGYFGTDKIWDDGLAEVAKYDAKKMIYNHLWDNEMVLITVKEDLSKKYHVKADPPYEGKELVPVLKLNVFTRIQTYNYPYHYLISVFVKRSDVAFPVKMTVSSQEWCGNTFKEFINWKRPAEFVYHSYFDGQADGRVKAGFEKGNMLREQLFLSLRALDFRQGLERKFKLLESQMTNKFRAPVWEDAELRVTGREGIRAMGKEIDCWKVVVKTPSQEMNFWFDARFPHALVKYADSIGQEMVLKEISRRTYWTIP